MAKFVNFHWHGGTTGYARHISNVDSVREGDLRVPKPERPPSRSHPVGHGTRVTSSMCNTIDFCLYASVFNMEVMPKMFLTSHYSDRIVILIPSHTTLLTNTGQGAIASASVLHPIDYQPWSWGLSGQGFVGGNY